MRTIIESNDGFTVVTGLWPSPLWPHFKKSDGWTRAMVEEALRKLL